MIKFSNNKVPIITYPPMINLSILILLFMQLHLFTIRVTCYDPVENFAVNCGSSGDSTNNLHTRNWTGDNGSKLFSPIESQNHHSLSAKALHYSPSVDPIPYGTARLSRFEFTYSFLVTDGQKFIRLHFYPALYANFDRSNSLFSVKANRYTLLKDFNASVTADSDDNSEGTVSREYCINVEPGQRLNITFMPSPAHPDAYAFINGIEIVSMPTDLYYTKPNDQEFLLVDRKILYQIDNNSALETVYRINVGGEQIPSEKDTGMFRYWDDDNNYVETLHSRSTPAGFGLKLKDNGQNDSAPDKVYLTARTYGMNETSKYNLTWEFEVDSGFTYMVRLHFCEFEQEIQNSGDRVFQIFIADNLATDLADVISWSGGNLIPVHKDYAVYIWSRGHLKKRNLSIKLQPHPNKVSSYRDVILNGIEIFKVNDSSGNLGGPNPDPSPSPLPSVMPSSKPEKKPKKTTLVLIVISAASVIISLSVIVLLIFRRSSRRRHVSLVTSKSSKGQGSSLPSDLCRYFTIAEIRAATNNFDDILVIGIGGFGNVYKGYIDDGTTPVAIKRLKPGSQQGAREFETEIEMLSQLRHLHLVSLIGYCNDGNEMILVYDFMARGTLRDHLYDSDSQPLSWKQRLEICLGAARGLHYLHAGAKHNIIHRDVKTTNILLDEKWVAKVSDFGLSKVGPTGMSMSHISTVVKGSLGYLDPEYYMRQRLTLKSDVYSFGVVLLEVLCGRRPLLRAVDKQEANLVDWALECNKNGEINRMIDPVLRGTITPKCLNRFIEIALCCLLDDGNQRPSMNDVVWGLEFAMQLQESMEGTGLISGTEVEKKGEEKAQLTNIVNDDEESDMLFTSTDESSTKSKRSKMSMSSSEEQTLDPGMVFSELADPRGR